MAISFSRPDPSSPAAVSEATFNTGRRGYDQQEVRDFLRMVAAELARLQERERFLERELRDAQQHPATGARVDDDTVTQLLGEEATRILTAARESANAIRAKSEEGAARLLRESSEEAQRQREEADLEAARRRSEAVADAEAERAMAKQQGREMVEEARTYREKVLGELSRRRELARQQLEHLIHGRERLIQAFERARMVAVDVVAEMTPVDEPDEFVDLSPTTGPVPIMVPASRVGDASAIDESVLRVPTDPPSDAMSVTDEDEEIQPPAALYDGGADDVEVADVEVADAPAPSADDKDQPPPSDGDLEIAEDEADEADELDEIDELDDADDAGDADDAVDEVDAGDEVDDDAAAADVADLFARLRDRAVPEVGADDVSDDADEEVVEETPFVNATPPSSR